MIGRSVAHLHVTVAEWRPLPKEKHPKPAFDVKSAKIGGSGPNRAHLNF
jgi:hypothetical protein